MKNIVLYAGALYNRKNKKINAIISSVVASTTIFAVSMNIASANTNAKDSLVKTNIVIEDTISNEKETIDTYRPLLGDNCQTPYATNYDNQELTNLLDRLDSSTKDVVVYDTAWTVEDNKFVRTVDTYYFKEGMKDYKLDELDNIKPYLVDSKLDVKARLKPDDILVKESLKNIHIDQNVNDLVYNEKGFLFNSLLSILVGILPSFVAIVSYIIYKKCKNNDFTNEELENLKKEAMLEYDQIICKIQNNPSYLKELEKEYNNLNSIFNSKKSDIYDEILDCYNSICEGKDKEETIIFNDDAKLFTKKKGI